MAMQANRNEWEKIFTSKHFSILWEAYGESMNSWSHKQVKEVLKWIKKRDKEERKKAKK